ncbi:MAG: H-NS histone family protein [Magnetococcales bacterium]|nr:H-NS histone family protein [Magnetococcales bacterium]
MAHLKNKSIPFENIDVESLDLKTLTAIKIKIEALIKLRQIQHKNEFKQKLDKKASSLGIDLKEYFETPFHAQKQPYKAKLKAKYEYQGVKWSGRGRCPKIFQLYFDNGGKKADLLIDKQDK